MAKKLPSTKGVIVCSRHLDGSSPLYSLTKTVQVAAAMVTAFIVIYLPPLQVSASTSDDSSRRPNVVLIMTDDMGWGDLSCHGNPHLSTPQLDKLSERSVRFERFFVSPVCAPTRASLLTGRYDVRTGVTGVSNRWEVVRANEFTVAEMFQDAGYKTACFGKWHNGEQFPNHPLGQGFDSFFGFCGGHWNSYFDTTLEHSFDKRLRGVNQPTKGYLTDVLTDQAVSFIKRQSLNRESPFFCYVPYNAPHWPAQIGDKYYDRFANKNLDAAAASAYAMVENLDDNIGRILNTLDQFELTENTIVIFLTDNGVNSDRFNGGMRGRKGSVHEGGVRVPCFISWPGKLKPRNVPQIAAHIDILPTLAELAGIPIRKSTTATKKGPVGPLDGKSLTPLLNGNSSAWPDRMLFTFRASKGKVTRGAVRTQQYRFVRDRRDELYDMQQDPGQKQNISGVEVAVFEKMQRAFNDWQTDLAKQGSQKLPIPVGYAESPLVELPGVEATLSGEIGFRNNNGYAHDWIANWKSTNDTIAWELDVARQGEYEVILSFACQKKDVGSLIEWTIGDQKQLAKVNKAFTEPEWGRPERINQKGTRWMRNFTTMTLGKVKLSSGPTTLAFKAKKIADENVCEVDSARLRYIGP